MELVIEQPKEKAAGGRVCADGKARIVVLDIETYRTRDPRVVERIRQDAIEREPNKTASKEEKLLWHTEEAREQRLNDALARTSVNVLCAEVLCASISTNLTHPGPTWDCMSQPEEEQLRDMAEFLDDFTGANTIWVGHNLKGFDLKILVNRWRRFGIRPPKHFPSFSGGRWFGRVYDTMERVPAPTPFISLDEACEIYNVEQVVAIHQGQPMHGGRVGEAYEGGHFGLLLEYVRADVETERRLYMAMTHGDTWGTWLDDDATAEAIAEIEAAPLTEAAKAIAVLNVLKSAGLVPRAKS